MIIKKLKSLNWIKLLIWIGAINLLIFSALVAYSFLHIEKPDPGRDAFYAADTKPIPDDQNIAIALAGLNAPAGVDIIKHGRFVIDAYKQTDSNKIAETLIAQKKEISFTGKPDELLCWVNDAFKKIPKNCASAARISAFLIENKLLLNRYADLQKLPYSQGVIKNVMTVIHVNELLAAEIKLDIKNKKSEAAYQKWHINHQFINRVFAQEGGLVNRGLFLSLYEISLDTLEFMLFESPNITKQHADELLITLKPSGLEKYNIQGMLKLEHNSKQKYVTKMHSTSVKIQPEYIANREYRVNLDFLKEAQKLPFTFEESQNKLFEQYYYSAGNDYLDINWLNPLNSILSKVVVNNVLKGFRFVELMHSKNALVKLLNLKIRIQQQNIVDADIQAFLNNAGSAYLNPFTNKPMRWIATKRVLICDKPNSDKSPVEVRL